MREHFENLRFAPLVLAGNLSSPTRREVPAAVLLAEARGNKEKVANAGGDSAYVHEKKLALCAAGRARLQGIARRVRWHSAAMSASLLFCVPSDVVESKVVEFLTGFPVLPNICLMHVARFQGVGARRHSHSIQRPQNTFESPTTEAASPNTLEEREYPGGTVALARYPRGELVLDYSLIAFFHWYVGGEKDALRQ